MRSTQITDEGPEEWVRRAVARFERPLTLYATRLLGDGEAARDVVQDTFLRLCGQARAEIDTRLAEWLFTVCRHRALDVLRKEGRMTQLSDEQAVCRASAEANPAEAAADRDALGRVLDLLERLPASQREVIRLKFQNGFSYREISRISGHTVTNVGYLIHVGLKTLRSQLQPHDGQPARAKPQSAPVPCQEVRP
jgi:RNA polymerase sigma-70 factor (ECF subfamily)